MPIADRGPASLVPPWVCRSAMGIAYWEGVRSIEPSYGRLRAALAAPMAA
jgi:hypothetical protein